MTQPAPVGMNTAPSVFCASFELSASKWKLGFSDGARRKLATVDAKDWKAVEVEIARARQRFGIEEKAPLFSCYEAGRDGFWIHRELEKRSIRNIVVDPSSIEVSRSCLLYTSDAADERSSVDLGGRRIIKKKKKNGEVSVELDIHNNGNAVVLR